MVVRVTSPFREVKTRILRYIELTEVILSLTPIEVLFSFICLKAEDSPLHTMKVYRGVEVQLH